MAAHRRGTRSFTYRLTLALAALLLLFGAVVALLGRHVGIEHERETLQRVSHGLAQHIVEHWPYIAVPDPDAAERAARAALLSMLTVVNPGVQVYVLDAEGRVDAYLGEPGMVRTPQVDLRPVRQFLAGAALPLRGTDPMGLGEHRIFSAAMFAPRAGDVRPPGYLYVVLDGQARKLVAEQLSLRRFWQGAGLAMVIGLLITLAVGAFTFRRITRPLNQLAGRLRQYSAPADLQGPADRVGPRPMGDEVHSIGAAFDDMTRRIEAQAARETQLANAHRETMAGVAHDLRTPLTAMHGHLEAMASTSLESPARRDRLLAAALAQSERVRRLSQQLFELSALQSSDQVLHRERFRLDELVTDVVQKFELVGDAPAVALGGTPPGHIECDGDFQLIERALTNLIDNALRHAPSAEPVRVSLCRVGAHAQIVVEDGGPGLPRELVSRLLQGRSVRDPPLHRPRGGIGGLGLAIAQRVASLHGGSLTPLPSSGSGTRLCLTLGVTTLSSPA